MSAHNQGILYLKYSWQAWHLTFHSLFYNTGCVAMRNYFVKSSRQVKIIGSSVKKDHFIYKCLAGIESLNLFSVLSFYYLQMGKTGRDRSTILLYHTCLGKWKIFADSWHYHECLDPWREDYSIPMFKVMPVNQFILHATNISNIYLNLILFKYLDTNSRNNTGSETNFYSLNSSRLLLPSTQRNWQEEESEEKSDQRQCWGVHPVLHVRVRLHPAGAVHHPHQPRREAVHRQPDRRPGPVHHHPRHCALQRSNHQKSVKQFTGKVLYL